MLTDLFLVHALIQSGINLLSDQSPPPTTFPALATTKEILVLLRPYHNLVLVIEIQAYYFYEVRLLTTQL